MPGPILLLSLSIYAFDKGLPEIDANHHVFYSQTKTIEVSVDALQNGDPSLPPLMNPTMLEASDDLTNLSHLNEPAGTSTRSSMT